MFTAENPRTPAHRFTIVSVGASESDFWSLWEILRSSCWTLYHLRTYREARAWLISNPAAVVISESSVPDGSWKDILNLVMEHPKPPNLIVSSRLADDRLWAEVLNLGGYDLLATPFQAEEVLRVVSMACHSWERKGPQTIVPSKPPESAGLRRPHTWRALAAGAD